MKDLGMDDGRSTRTKDGHLDGCAALRTDMTRP